MIHDLRDLTQYQGDAQDLSDATALIVWARQQHPGRIRNWLQLTLKKGLQPEDVSYSLIAQLQDDVLLRLAQAIEAAIRSGSLRPPPTNQSPP